MTYYQWSVLKVDIAITKWSWLNFSCQHEYLYFLYVFLAYLTLLDCCGLLFGILKAILCHWKRSFRIGHQRCRAGKLTFSVPSWGLSSPNKIYSDVIEVPKTPFLVSPKHFQLYFPTIASNYTLHPEGFIGTLKFITEDDHKTKNHESFLRNRTVKIWKNSLQSFIKQKLPLRLT